MGIGIETYDDNVSFSFYTFLPMKVIDLTYVA